MTITIDRGHYDCAGTNYAVIVVKTETPIAFINANPQPQPQPQFVIGAFSANAMEPKEFDSLQPVALKRRAKEVLSERNALSARVEELQEQLAQPQPQSQPFYCSFFSQKVTKDMDTNALHPHWLGNCCVYLGADFETHPCSYRHESGHAKTWRKANKDEVSEGEFSDDGDAVSVDPFPPTNDNKCNANKNIKSKSLNTKDNLRIIQLQKKNLGLRTELDALKANLEAMKADICTIKAQLGATNLTQRLNEQEVWIKRANQCMQDWTNKGVIDRVWILETQHAYLRSEHLKHKEQQQQQQRLQTQQQQQPQIQQQPQQNKCCKSLRKKLKKQHTRHESVCSEILERLTRLEATRNVMNEPCNKCNDDKCNDDKCNDDDDDNKENCNIIHNPFDFNTIYDQNYYMNTSTHDDDNDNECPALDLIVNHYEDFVPAVPSNEFKQKKNICCDIREQGDKSFKVQDNIIVAVPSVAVPNPDNDNNDDDNDDAYDDDMFELIQIDLN